MTIEAGPVGPYSRAIFEDPVNADVLFLGSSMVREGIDVPTLEQALSKHLGRPAHVVVLGMNWQGQDLQYFMLRDYLQQHRPKLIIWNLPAPGSRNLEPHLQAFRFVRFGEYSEAEQGLPLRYRLALYSDMVLGAPRELYSHLRPNRLSDKERSANVHAQTTGYYGAPFVPDTEQPARLPLQDAYEVPPYSLVRSTGKPLNVYEVQFVKDIADLVNKNHIPLALIHVPLDSERGMDYMPERGDWPLMLHTNAPMIGIPSALLFQSMSVDRFYHFFRDQHLNLNGSIFYTRSVLPAVLEAYDRANERN